MIFFFLEEKLKVGVGFSIEKIIDYCEKGWDDIGYRFFYVIMERDGVNLEF